MVQQNNTYRKLIPSNSAAYCMNTTLPHFPKGLILMNQPQPEAVYPVFSTPTTPGYSEVIVKL